MDVVGRATQEAKAEYTIVLTGFWPEPALAKPALECRNRGGGGQNDELLYFQA